MLDPQESPEEIKSRELVLDPQESPEEINIRKVGLRSEGWTSFASVVSEQQCSCDSVLATLLLTAVETTVAQYTNGKVPTAST